MSLRVSKYALVAVFFSLVAIAVSACGAIGGGGTDARVTRVILTADVPPNIDQSGTALNARNFFAPNTKEIIATVGLENVAKGDKIGGKWFQLGTSDAGKDGQEVRGSDINIAEGDLIDGTRSVVTFRLVCPPAGCPEDSWLLRIYAEGDLIRTSAFIVTRFAQASASPSPQPTTVAGGSSTPTVVPTPASYTVATGDTLTTIAQRFLPANEQLNNFLARLAALNNIPTNATLQAGQVVRIPPANP